MKRQSNQQILESLVKPEEAQTFERPKDRRHAIIIFTPRSGSSWLADLLIKTGKFGSPNEFVNNAFWHLVPFKVRTERDFLHAIETRSSTPNKVFCLEATWGHIERFETLNFFEHYRDAIFFHLRRRDIIMQAISCMIATETGLFHRVGNEVNAIGEVKNIEILSHPRLLPLIRQWCAHLLYSEWMTEYSLLNNRREAIRIYYEDLVASPDDFVRSMLMTVGEVPTGPVVSNFRKLGDATSEKIKERFLNEEPDFIAQLERLRAPLQETSFPSLATRGAGEEATIAGLVMASTDASLSAPS